MSVAAVDAKTDRQDSHDQFLHYAQHDNPDMSLCGITVITQRVFVFRQDEICRRCVDLMLDWVAMELDEGREIVGAPHVFKAIRT